MNPLPSRRAGGFLRHLSDWAPVILWMAAIFFVSAQPTLPLPPDAFWAEVLSLGGHFAEYAVLAALAYRALCRTGLPPPRAAWLAFGLALAYAFSDEWHQSFVPGRSRSLLDITADAAGAATALLLLRRARWPGERAAG